MTLLKLARVDDGGTVILVRVSERSYILTFPKGRTEFGDADAAYSAYWAMLARHRSRIGGTE